MQNAYNSDEILKTTIYAGIIMKIVNLIKKMNYSIWAIALFALLLTACSAGNHSGKMPDVIQDHVKYLSDESLEGRGTGSEGNQKAAEYIVKKFKKYGLSPAEDSYFQEFSVTTEVKVGEGNAAVFERSGERIDWEADSDFRPVTFSKDTTITAGLVFAGYGITAKEQDFDEYANIDATGKIAIVLRSSPDYANPHGLLAQFAPLEYKMRNAQEHGAVGVIFVSSTDIGDVLMPLNLRLGGNSSNMIALHALRDAIDQVLPSGRSLDDLEPSIKENTASQSFELTGVSATLTSSLVFVKQPTNNVLGVVKGSDPARANEFLVVGAHYDHLGWGDRGGSRYEGDEPKIHHGADDNASGTAAMMEVARNIAANPLPRSVLFMGFSGEEMGLLGSAHYVQNPVYPIDNTVMMLNMDMIGRVENGHLNVTGTGTSSTWNELVDTLSLKHGLNISKSAGGFGASDHSSFNGQKIPVLNLFSGLHDDYHRPSDTWEKINYEGLSTVVNFATDIITEIGNYDERPDYVEVKSEGREGRRMSFKVSSGVIPDYADHPKGMRITGVKKDGAADKAGLESGDIIISMGGAEVKNIYDYTYVLGKYKPGDVVEVTVLRGENEDKVTMEMTFEARN